MQFNSVLRAKSQGEDFPISGQRKKVQVGNDQKKAQPERNSHSKSRGYLYLETIS